MLTAPGFREEYVTANGLRLHCVAAGDGALMLFLHGFPEFWYEWKEQLKEFGKDHLAVLPICLDTISPTSRAGWKRIAGMLWSKTFAGWRIIFGMGKSSFWWGMTGVARWLGLWPLRIRNMYRSW
jgi:pimeloyl-ACP methyl ester carboxylesterase